MPAIYLKNADLAEEIRQCQANGMVVSTRLARMLMLLVDRVAAKTNWRSYSYVSDMKAEALLQLVKPNGGNSRNPDDTRPNILKFNFAYAERNGSSPNPFSYATQIVINVFRRQVRLEGLLAECKDDLLEEHGILPSARRQAENDFNRSSEAIPPRPVRKSGRRRKPSGE